ncbi:sucrose-phosphatase 2-like isoform X1 [Populus alba x Populus x berolinensis]|nr:sucrose-phosphatase 2-like isoform X1 [Populus alba x Populus x berolinensis]
MSKKTRLIIPEGARYEARERKRLLLDNEESLSGADRPIMDRLDGSAHLIIVSDLDFTMWLLMQVDHLDPDNLGLLRFNAMWEAYYRQDSLLVFSTGRSPTIYKQLRKEKPLLTPDIAIMSVGTEIMYGESMIRDEDWEQYLNKNWNREIVTEETAQFPELTPQSETEQRPHKVSFFVEKIEALKVIRSLSERLEKRGLDVKLVYSNETALDVLPKGAGKGQALAYLLEKFKIDGKMPVNTLVCGDSGNDAELFSVPGVYGAMVSNAQEELLQWHAENARNNPNIIHATERCAAGIIQAIGNFSLGPNVSPRDIRDFQKCKVEIFNSSHEVVKFYLFYERWRRAEVAKNMQTPKLIFFPFGTFVHPSGVEQSVNHCIDVMARLHGDKQGTNYRIWVDRVSSAQVGSDTWLVKFYKWESFGEERHGCLTTVLLSSKYLKEMSTRYHYSFSVPFHSLAFLVCFIIVHASPAAADKPTELVDKVCNQTSNYTFCVEALYSDSRAPDADSYTLAFISFGLAYSNANNARDYYIAELLKNTSGQDYHFRLETCRHDYLRAVSKLGEAYNDLNSETFFGLAELAGIASRASDHCRDAFKGISSPPLGSRNGDLKRLCEIGATIAKLFTGSS